MENKHVNRESRSKGTPGKSSFPWIAAVILALVIGLFVGKRSFSPPSEKPQPVAPPQTRSQQHTDSQSEKPVRLQRGASPPKSFADGGDVEKIWEKDTYENRLLRNLLNPFNADELRRLSNDPQQDERRFIDLLLRAAAEKDIQFRDLLDRQDLRRNETVDLALSAYDYAVNENREALNHILAAHAEESERGVSGWDSGAIWVLGFIDEWDLTKAALQARSLSGDGAGGDSRYAFWLQRRYLYPLNPEFPQDYNSFLAEVHSGR